MVCSLQVSQRLLAVELAPVLLQTFKDPFAPSPVMDLATPASRQVGRGPVACACMSMHLIAFAQTYCPLLVLTHVLMGWPFALLLFCV